MSEIKRIAFVLAMAACLVFPTACSGGAASQGSLQGETTFSESSASSEAAASSSSAPKQQAKKRNGLVKEGNGYYFYAKGKKVTCAWRIVKGKKYYFTKSGKAQTSKRRFKRAYCYFNAKGQLIRKIDLTKKLIAITYDDGPSVYTPTILKVLKKYDSVATFFVVGSRLSWNQKAAKKEAALGCEIGNHTYSHNMLTGKSRAKARLVVKKCSKAIKKYTGTSCELLRPPGGETNSTVKKTIDMPEILWSIDTRDWATLNTQRTIRAVLKGAKDGDIVLMHDLYKQTARAAKTIIPKLVKRGFELVTVSELADCKGVKLKHGKVYCSIR